MTKTPKKVLLDDLIYLAKEHNFHLFPVGKGKMPFGREINNKPAPYGLKKGKKGYAWATTDVDQITKWYKAGGWSGWATVPGFGGYFVIDLDVKGDDKENESPMKLRLEITENGLQYLKEKENPKPLFQYETQSKGGHLFYKDDGTENYGHGVDQGSYKIKNKPVKDWCPSFDTRHCNGYVQIHDVAGVAKFFRDNPNINLEDHVITPAQVRRCLGKTARTKKEQKKKEKVSIEKAGFRTENFVVDFETRDGARHDYAKERIVEAFRCYYPNTPDKLETVLARIKQAALDAGIDANREPPNPNEIDDLVSWATENVADDDASKKFLPTFFGFTQILKAENSGLRYNTARHVKEILFGDWSVTDEDDKKGEWCQLTEAVEIELQHRIREKYTMPDDKGVLPWSVYDTDFSKYLVLASHGEGNLFDPLKDYILKLPKWDEIDRLEHWLLDGFDPDPQVDLNDPEKAERLRLNQWISKHLILSLLTTTLEPGFWFREMIVLYSAKQKVGKSLVCKLILPDDLRNEFFTDSIQITDSYADQVEMLCQAKQVEFAEMAEFNRANRERLKALISRTTNKTRLKYRADPKAYKRKYRMVGTTNEQDCLPYDPSGNTRFVPFVCEQKWEPLEMIAYFNKNRDQLFAEALVLYNQGDKGTLPSDLEAEQERIVREFTPTPHADIYYLIGKLMVENTFQSELFYAMQEIRTAVDQAATKRGPVRKTGGGDGTWSEARVKAAHEKALNTKIVSNVLRSLLWEKSHKRKGNMWQCPSDKKQDSLFIDKKNDDGRLCL